MDWLFYSNREAWYITYAIPNGGHRHIAVAAKMKKEGVKPGIPDIHMPIPNKSFHGLYIEFKVHPNKCTASQKLMIDRLLNNGYQVAICYTLEDAIKITQEYLNDPI